MDGPRPRLRGQDPAETGPAPAAPASPSLVSLGQGPPTTPRPPRPRQTLEGAAERPLCRPAAPPACGKAPGQPRGSPSRWGTPEPPQEGKSALLEVSQQNGPRGTSCLPRLRKHSLAAGTKGLCLPAAPRLPAQPPLRAEGGPPGGDLLLRPRPVLPRQETLPESSCRLAGQRWSTASRDQGTGGGGRGLGPGWAGGLAGRGAGLQVLM